MNLSQTCQIKPPPPKNIYTYKWLANGALVSETIPKKQKKSSSSNKPKETERKKETMYYFDEEMMDVAGLAERSIAREFTTTEKKRTLTLDEIGINPVANWFLYLREIVEEYSPELMSKEQ